MSLESLSFLDAIQEEQRVGFLHSVVDDICGRAPDYGGEPAVSGTRGAHLSMQRQNTAPALRTPSSGGCSRRGEGSSLQRRPGVW